MLKLTNMRGLRQASLWPAEAQLPLTPPCAASGDGGSTPEKDTQHTQALTSHLGRMARCPCVSKSVWFEITILLILAHPTKLV